MAGPRKGFCGGATVMDYLFWDRVRGALFMALIGGFSAIACSSSHVDMANNVGSAGNPAAGGEAGSETAGAATSGSAGTASTTGGGAITTGGGTQTDGSVA